MTLFIVSTNIIVIEKKFDNLSFKSKHSFLNEFFNELDELNNVNPQKKVKKRKKLMCMIKHLNYMIFLEFLIINTMSYQMIKEKKKESKYNPKDLFLDWYDYNLWSQKE